MKKLVCIILLAALIIPVLSVITDGKGSDVYTYLVAGLDDVAGNTDSVILLNYDFNSNYATVLQIPRDTVCNYHGEEIKINSIFPKEIAKGKDTDSALEVFSRYISSVLGIKIRGFVGLTLSAFRRFVDNLEGVDIYLENDISFDDGQGNTLSFKKGSTRLFGREAEYFVRYRKGYLTGDVGRVDMQKVFLLGLINRLKSGLSLDVAVRLLKDGGDGVLTNAKTTDIVGLLMKNRGRIKSAEVFFATLPGLAVESARHGWVYAVNKKASARLIYEQGFLPDSAFDESLSLLINEEKIKEIYYDENINWHKYSEKDINNITVK